MIRLKSLVIFIIGVALSIFLYMSHGDDTSLTTEGFFSMMILFFIAFPTAITGFVLVIKDIDLLATEKRKDQSKISQIYMGIKFLFGIVSFVAGIYFLYHFFIDPPIGFSGKIIFFIFISVLIFQGFRMSANAYLSFTGKEIS